MAIESTGLGALRRTHYSDSITSEMDGQKATIMGWVLTVRGHGNITFVTIRDKNGDIPIVAKKGMCSDDVREAISVLRVHSSVAISGVITASSKAPDGFEIIPDNLYIFSKATKVPPFEPLAKTVKNIDTRLEVRPIDLRRSVLQHVFQARGVILRSIRDYFASKGFVEINTPKIISSATEGGAALFSIFYYDKQAFLAQSPQLYKEQLTMSFEKVFEIAPIFRAESSRTNRHLSEAISIDLEEAFVDYTDVMERIGDILKLSVDAIHDYIKNNNVTGFNVPTVPQDIPQYTYAELVERIRSTDIDIEWGDDLHPSALKKIHLDGFYFIKDWPLGPKPFYVKESVADPNVSESFDLMFGDLELSSGSTRIERRDILEDKMRKKGMNVDSFGYHLEAFEYGMPPHAGCGIGLERLVMALTGIENIRDTSFYPRDVDRLTP